MDELKPCPFCGGEAFLNFPSSGNIPFVMCKSCASAGPQSEASKAVDGWNQRANVFSQTEQVELVADTIRESVLTYPGKARTMPNLPLATHMSRAVLAALFPSRKDQTHG